MITNKIDKKSYATRTISILDETGSIVVTLWQDHVREQNPLLVNIVSLIRFSAFQARNFNDDSNPVIAFKAIKIHDFNGCQSFSPTTKTNFKINPVDTERNEQLKQWFHEQHPDTRKIANLSIIQVSNQQGLNDF